jgi:hypothetical protein
MDLDLQYGKERGKVTSQFARTKEELNKAKAAEADVYKRNVAAAESKIAGIDADPKNVLMEKVLGMDKSKFMGMEFTKLGKEATEQVKDFDKLMAASGYDGPGIEKLIKMRQEAASAGLVLAKDEAKGGGWESAMTSAGRGQINARLAGSLAAAGREGSSGMQGPVAMIMSVLGHPAISWYAHVVPTTLERGIRRADRSLLGTGAKFAGKRVGLYGIRGDDE